MAEPNSMIRVGIVSDIDTEKRRVRVYYPELSDMVSDWLYVLQRPFYGDEETAPFRIHVTNGEVNDHTHPAWVTYEDGSWLPVVDAVVLVLYTHGFNTDGYVLGVIP